MDYSKKVIHEKKKKLTEKREEELECPCGKNQDDKLGGREE